MRWMYDSFLLPSIGQDGHYIVRLKYQRMIEWIEGSPATKEAQIKLTAAERNRVMEEFLSLAEQHAPTHSMSANQTTTSSALKFPYTCMLPAIQFITQDLGMAEEYSSISAMAIRNHLKKDDVNLNPSDDLVYPFEDPDATNNLPIPSPIATSSLLPSDAP